MLRVAAVLALVLLTTGCGGGGGGNGGQAAGLLAGAAKSTAMASLTEVTAPRAPPEDVEGGVILTRVSLVLAANATVANVNAVAHTLGATGIARARAGSPFVTLIVPRQADAGALQRLVDRVRGAKGIVAAEPGRELATNQLPSDGVQTAPADELDHLLVTRFPAAWNAARLALDHCAAHQVTVLVPDIYFDALPAAFRDQVPGAVDNFVDPPLAFLNPALSNFHGYEVLQALAGRFDPAAPTGANPFPQCLRIVPVNVGGLDAYGAVDVTRAAIERENDKIIVNVSVGYPIELCGDHANKPCAVADINDALAPRFKDAIALRVGAGTAWAGYAMQQDVVANTLFAVAAGNERNADLRKGFLGEAYAGLHSARLASPMGMATELPDLASLLADQALWKSIRPNLPDLRLDATVIDALRDDAATTVADPVTDRNLSLVGSVTNASDPSVLQIAPESNDGADLLAVGEVVTLDASLPTIVNGTSFSAPQVAGLASYLWLLDDNLRAAPVAETLKLIRATARSGAGTHALVDAYAAVLALDARDHGTAVRSAILDVNDDDVFDLLDLDEFVTAYGLGDPNTPTIPTAPDYSRFDLNGDGFTGGVIIDRVDLDANGLDVNGAPIIGSVTQRIEGIDITMNEAALSDLQVLCYYAYSPLYASDQGGPKDQARTRLLGPDHCIELRLNAQLPAQIGASAPLTVNVQKPIANGQFAPADNLLMNFTSTCGTVSPASGRSDANGTLVTTVTPSAGCSSVSVAIVGSADLGTTPLVRGTVTAAVASSGRVLSGQLQITNDRVLTTNTGNGNSSEHDILAAQVRAQVAADGHTVSLIDVTGHLAAQFSLTESIACHPDGLAGDQVIRTVTLPGSWSADITGGAFLGANLTLSGTNTVQSSDWVDDGCSVVTTTSVSGWTSDGDTRFRLIGNFIQDANGQLTSIDFTGNDDFFDTFGAHVTRVVSGSLNP